MWHLKAHGNHYPARAVLTALAFFLIPIAPARAALPPDVKAVVDQYPCLTCHKIGDVGSGELAPNLRFVGDRRKKDWLLKWLTNPPEMKPGTIMPAMPIPQEQKNLLVDFLLKQKNPDIDRAGLKKLVEKKPVETGRQLMEKLDCQTCHKMDGKGGNGSNTGPDLKGVVARRGEKWLRRWLKDPQKVKPGTFMPTFGFNPKEVDALITYLKTLH